MYELRPYIYAIVSAYAFYAAKGSPLLLVSGSLLMLSAVLVGKMRYSYRRDMAAYIQQIRR